MNNYIIELPIKPTFSQKGLNGFMYGLQNRELEIYFVDSIQGHDTYIICKKCTHIYYVIDGEGYFEIEGQVYDVKAGVLVEVLPKVEYTYTGKMKLILIMNPPWFEGNEEVVKNNEKTVKI